jgi:dihydrofolate reductase
VTVVKIGDSCQIRVPAKDASEMKISLIAAMAERVIGRGAAIPWTCPMTGDALSLPGPPGRHGRKTFETLDGPLPGRENIVLTRDRDYRRQAAVVQEWDEVLVVAGAAEELFICGGGGIRVSALATGSF